MSLVDLLPKYVRAAKGTTVRSAKRESILHEQILKALPVFRGPTTRIYVVDETGYVLIRESDQVFYIHPHKAEVLL